MKISKIIASVLSAAVLASAGVASCFNSLAANTSDTDWGTESYNAYVAQREKQDDSCVYVYNSGLQWNSSQRRYVSVGTNTVIVGFIGDALYNGRYYFYNCETNRQNSWSRKFNCDFNKKNLRINKGNVRVVYQYIYENYRAACSDWGIPYNKAKCIAEFHFGSADYKNIKVHGQWSPDTYGTGYTALENQ
ncbi:MAG: hypothetical protein K6G33_14755 [Ruminococcus sp.]|uniref:hypothetical protein n=1 Tax=Ruminococcus sp. TaxID=41978 RepID=UPI0025E0A0E6|nr:hypothetical protein [Ruminococcus sp.]MCR5601984.1 hypothetical protein [Ruminococcus sp.]